MAHIPVGAGFTVTSNGAAAVDSPFSTKTDTLRVIAVGKNGHIAIGTNPVATHTDYMVLDGIPETISIGGPRAQRVVGITTGTTTTLDFEEGLGSAFQVGDYVTLTVNGGQSYYNFTHQPVVSVNNSSNYNGYFSTRIGIGTDTSGIVTAFNGNFAELRNSLRLSFISEGGSGYVYCQQVQITGQA